MIEDRDTIFVRRSRNNDPTSGRHHFHLPHRPLPGATQFVTFRLADSLPIGLFGRYRVLDPMRTSNETRLIEASLDAGHGACHLRDPRIARIMQDALLSFHRVRYTVHAWVVMPNHVHVLVTPGDSYPLARLIQSWKCFTAINANRVLGRVGRIWQRDYFDRIIRNLEHFLVANDYIEENPVKAGLCRSRDEWPFSSASVWKYRVL